LKAKRIGYTGAGTVTHYNALALVRKMRLATGGKNVTLLEKVSAAILECAILRHPHWTAPPFSFYTDG
jgi:hypothetical protein